MLDYLSEWIRAEPFISVLLIGAAIGLFGAAFAQPREALEAAVWPWMRHFIETCMASALLLGSLFACYEVLDSNVRTFTSVHDGLTQTHWQGMRSVWGDWLFQKELVVNHFVRSGGQVDGFVGHSARPATSGDVGERQPLPQNSITGFNGSVEIVLSEPEKRESGHVLYNTYNAKARYEYEVTNMADLEADAEFIFPLSSKTILYRDFSIIMDDQDITAQVQHGDDFVTWTSRMAAGQKRHIVVTYTAIGMDGFYYQLPVQRELRNFSLVVTLNTRAFFLIVEPESDVLQPTPTLTEDQKGIVLSWSLDRLVTSGQVGVALAQFEKPYAPYERLGHILEYGPKGLMLLGALFILTLLIFGRSIRFWEMLLLVGTYSIHSFFLAGIGEYPATFWAMWVLGAALSNLLAFFLFRRYAPLLLRGLLHVLVLLFTVYPLANLYWEVTQRNTVDSALQVGIIIYLFGLILYTRIRNQRENLLGG